MSGPLAGFARIAATLTMSAAVFGCTLLGSPAARADELPGLVGGPPPVDERVAPAAPAQPQAAPIPDAPAAAAPLPAVETAQATPRPAARPGTPARFEHWEINPTIMFTFSTGSDIVPPGKGVAQTGSPAGNTLPLDIVRLIGDMRYRFNPRYSLSFQRIAHTGSSGRTKPVAVSKANPLGGTYGGHSEDYEERFLLTDQMDRWFNVRAGYAIRTRECCPAAGAIGNKAPRIHTGFFSDVNWRFGPNGIGGKPLTVSFRWEEYRHNTILPRPAADSGTKPTFQVAAYSNFYFYHQTKLVPYYGIEYFSTYFSYSNAMTQTYRKVYGVQYRATRDVSWRAYVKNDQSGGVLASSGDSAHKSTLFVEGTYRLHF
jgi:hypothetical protein